MCVCVCVCVCVCAAPQADASLALPPKLREDDAAHVIEACTSIPPPPPPAAPSLIPNSRTCVWMCVCVCICVHVPFHPSLLSACTFNSIRISDGPWTYFFARSEVLDSCTAGYITKTWFCCKHMLREPVHTAAPSLRARAAHTHTRTHTHARARARSFCTTPNTMSLVSTVSRACLCMYVCK